MLALPPLDTSDPQDTDSILDADATLLAYALNGLTSAGSGVPTDRASRILYLGATKGGASHIHEGSGPAAPGGAGRAGPGHLDPQPALSSDPEARPRGGRQRPA